MSSAKLTPEKVLVSLQCAFDRYKQRLRDIGDWSEGEALRVLPRVAIGDLEDVSEEEMWDYARMLPELVRRGWVVQASDTDTEGIFSTIDLTNFGQTHAQKLIQSGAV